MIAFLLLRSLLLPPTLPVQEEQVQGQEGRDGGLDPRPNTTVYCKKAEACEQRELAAKKRDDSRKAYFTYNHYIIY